MFLGLLPLPHAAVQLVEPEVTMAGERAHSEFVGPGEGLAIVRLGRLLIWRVGLCGDLAEEAENPGLVAALLLLERKLEGTQGDFERVPSAAGQQMRLAEIGKEERVVGRAGRRRVGEPLPP
jgi:hypothetical protein